MERRISKERKKKLLKLAKLCNIRAVNPPPIIADILMCMDIAITPEETEFLLKMGEKRLDYDALRKLADMPEERFQPLFESVRHKGILDTMYTGTGERQFMIYPLFPAGWFDDTYLSDGEDSPEKREFAHYFEQAVRKLEKLNFFPVRPIFDLYSRKTLKTTTSIAAITPPGPGKKVIQVDETIEPSPSSVLPSHGVNELIEKYSDAIGVKHCFCRQWGKFTDGGCRLDLPSEICLSFGDKTKKYLETGVGRAISKEEAYSIVQDAQAKGAVHMVYYMEEKLDNPEGHLCNCCWDCCGVFRLYNMGAQPLLIKAFYYAALTADAGCTGCGTCVDYCPVNAIGLSDGEAIFKQETCIGCGQCEFQCPEEVVQLIPRERDVYLPILKKADCRL